MRLLWLGVPVVLALVAASVALLVLARRLPRGVELALGERPQTGLVELLLSLSAFTWRELALTLQRAAHGQPAEVPMESPLPHDPLTALRFDPATLRPPARGRRLPVAVEVTLGPRARRPLRLSFPVLVSGMGWGVALSTPARLALAQACAVAGTALNSGEGPPLPAERALSHRWIWQWGRVRWRGELGAGRVADMVELQVGQGAEGGISVVKGRDALPRGVRSRLPARRLVIQGGLPSPLARWVRRARALCRGAPVGVKLPASDHVEEDVEHLVSLGVDCIALDGAGAGTAGSPAVLSDHQGIPVAVAVARAHRWLQSLGVRERVSLIASGHVHSAAEVAKLLALGADAVAVGTAVLFALAHGQATKLLPRRGPSALLIPLPGTAPARLDPDLAAERAANWLLATRAELARILESLGLTHVRELSRHHLVAEREEVARALGVRWYGQAPAADGPLQSLQELATLARATAVAWGRVEERWPRPTPRPLGRGGAGWT